MAREHSKGVGECPAGRPLTSPVSTYARKLARDDWYIIIICYARIYLVYILFIYLNLFTKYLLSGVVNWM